MSDAVILDYGTDFLDIHGNERSMCDHVIALQKNVIPSENIYKWASNLRFVVADASEHALSGQEPKSQPQSHAGQPLPDPSRPPIDRHDLDHLASETLPLIPKLARQTGTSEHDLRTLFSDEMFRLDIRRREAFEFNKPGKLPPELMQNARCECQKMPSFRSFESRSLRITEPGEVGDCPHYVAISYRWPLESQPNGSDYQISSKGREVRGNAAPKSVLDRAINFTQHCGLRLFWVDQECIRQDDSQEKQAAIQCMDRVYERATVTAGLMNVTLDRQEEVDALDRLFRRDPMTAPQFVDALNILGKILADEWTQRAWIYQELTASDSRMILLLRCDPSFTRAHRVRPIQPESSLLIEGEYDILPIDLFGATEYLMRWPSITGHSLPENLGIRLRTIIVHWTGVLSGRFGIDIGQFRKGLGLKAPARQPLSAASAVASLRERLNTIVGDRVAIYGNMCAYPLRMDTRRLGQDGGVGSSLSTNLFALALLNGDMSLLVEFNKGREHFSWFPMDACLDDLRLRPSNVESGATPKDLRLEYAKISHEGLATEGFLWEVDTKIELDRAALLLDAFPDTTAKVGNNESLNKIESAPILWSVIKTLYRRSGYTKLVESLYRWLLGFSGQNPAMPVPDMRATGYSIQPSTEAAKLPPFDVNRKWESLGVVTDNTFGIDASWLIARALNKSCIWAGRCVGGEVVAGDGPFCIFDCDQPGYVFTPAAKDVDISFPLRQNAVSWHVDIQNPIESVQGSHYKLNCKRLVKGTWDSTASKSVEVCLAWNLQSTPSPKTVGKRGNRLVLPDSLQFPRQHIPITDLPVNDGDELWLPHKKYACKHQNQPTKRFCSACERLMTYTSFGRCVKCKVHLCERCRIKDLGCAGRHALEELYVFEQDERKMNEALPFAVHNKDLRGVIGVLGRVSANQQIPGGITALHVAAFEGYTEILQCLIKARASVDAVSPWGTPLHMAVTNGRVEIVRLILGEKPNLATKDKDGKTALHAAAEKGNLEIVKMLLEKGASVDMLSAVGTPLQLAASNGHIETARTILEKSPTLSIADGNGQTALHLAAGNGQLAIVKMILERIQDRSDLRDKSNRSAWMCALENEHDEICNILAEEGMAFNDLENDSSDEHADANQDSRLENRSQRQSVSEFSKDELSIFSQDSPDIPYLRFRIPPESNGRMMQLLVKKIAFRLISHDQGFSGDGNNHGTYAGSHTWFEVGLVSNDGSDSSQSLREEIQRNVHAKIESTTHVISWDWDTATPNIRKLMTALAEGKALGVFAKARYPAWENYVQSVEVKILYD